MLRRIELCVLVVLLLFLVPVSIAQTASSASSAAAGKETILKAAEITSAKLFPEQVFYRGKTAPTQLRNTAGVHFADGFYVLAGLVDTSGYSTSMREKYQAYLLTEVTLEIGGKQLKPGAYGIGFLNGGKFAVMDIGGNDVLQVASVNDANILRPMPLQVTAASMAGTYRLYAGRDYVEFHRAM